MCEVKKGKQVQKSRTRKKREGKKERKKEREIDLVIKSPRDTCHLSQDTLSALQSSLTDIDRRFFHDRWEFRLSDIESNCKQDYVSVQHCVARINKIRHANLKSVIKDAMGSWTALILLDN